ncbi:vWA domain-containing protein [Tautonia plasticadhaerens]|uniref:VWFA domain-containing protein n=1 Tax=Tautonia plasticadhaerens TaxID=2527974 RepID=A0A518H0A3_9BACT|nr:magnesium chelatase [Tautonia plasticadhaerens]QDV34277.1 hypothetical protein ElP_21620 [Tautonia plasticadhaerens]
MPPTRPAPPLIPALLIALIGWAAPALADDPKPPPADEPKPGAEADDGTQGPGPDRPRRVVGPVVRSSTEAADLLRDPGEDPYDPAIDWASLPPWQRTSFYGVRAKGTFFVFAVDCSGSMADDLRLYRAKQELRRCIGALRFPQRYLVVFYNDRPIPMGGGVPKSADQRGKVNTYAWLESVDAIGGTDPRGAMNLALGLQPDAVFLLSDGEFPPGTEEGIAATNRSTIPIHCIDLAGGLGAEQLRTIAGDSGGQYALRR